MGCFGFGLESYTPSPKPFRVSDTLKLIPGDSLEGLPGTSIQASMYQP